MGRMTKGKEMLIGKTYVKLKIQVCLINQLCRLKRSFFKVSRDRSAFITILLNVGNYALVDKS